ncbi:GNAT family N-acetyltransferase [Sphingomonas sp.]|uniref:GNAT family N-acetyltransferase n=1 Tax=Sphingomonas sp. TaxID=28214 RepID=UPI0031D8CB43
MTDAPVIHTDRLTLRPYEVGDFDAYAAMVADPVVVRHAGRPMTGEEAWMRLLRFIGHWSVFGHGLFAVLDRTSGLFLGETGFMEYRREVTPKLASSLPEAAWVFTSAAHGKGYAFEAAAAAHRWMEESHAPPATQCIISTANHGSIRLAERLGYRLHDAPDYRGAALRFVREVRTSMEQTQPDRRLTPLDGPPPPPHPRVHT